ncbi:lambda-exonuclease family protein, partial [Embleya sp. NPDC056538]
MTASTAAAALPHRAAAAPEPQLGQVAEYLGTFEDGSPEWHAARADGLGGSDIAAVLGLSPWESRFSLWHAKRGMGGEREVTDQMSMGKLIEPFICDTLFTRRFPDLEVERTGTWRNRARPWQIANPDRLAFDAYGRVYGVEAKNVKYDQADEWGEDGSDVIPVYYEAQVRHYMDTLGLGVYYVAAFFAGCDFKVFRLEADERQARIVRDAGAEFHRTVLEGIRPNLDGHTRTYQVLKAITEGCDQSDVEISAELADRFRS